MRHRWGRWSLVVLAVAVAAGAAAWTLRIEGRVREVRNGAVTASVYARSGRTAFGDLRRALAAMASPGQAAAGWSRRAEAALDDARRQLDALTALVAGADGRAAHDVFERLAESERRLREHATGGKPLLAADVAFGEAMPHVDDLERRLDAALDAVTSTADRDAAELRDRQTAILAGVVGALLAVVLVLVPIPRPDDAATAVAGPAANGAPAPAPVPDLPMAPAATPMPAVDLPELGAICERLAALRDAQALPGLLSDAARAIGARGMMLWLADASRQRLRVAAMAGYDPRLVERIGAVSAGDGHATAQAFRTAAPVVTPTGAGQPAAASIPVNWAGGVGGVLSVEFIGETPDGVASGVAAARVVAAQLSLLVAPAADSGGEAGDPATVQRASS